MASSEAMSTCYGRDTSMEKPVLVILHGAEVRHGTGLSVWVGVRAFWESGAQVVALNRQGQGGCERNSQQGQVLKWNVSFCKVL